MGQGFSVDAVVGKSLSRARAGRVALLAAVAAALLLGIVFRAQSSASAHPVAHGARTFTLSESGRLHLTSHKGFTLNEKGTATGTITGSIYIHLHVVSTNRVTAELSIYPKGGSLTGRATANYHPAGSVATFSGTMTIVSGSGRYAHAHGSGLSFSGTIQRTNDAVTVRVSGKMSA